MRDLHSHFKIIECNETSCHFSELRRVQIVGLLFNVFQGLVLLFDIFHLAVPDIFLIRYQRKENRREHLYQKLHKQTVI